MTAPMVSVPVEPTPCPFCGGGRAQVTNVRDGLRVSCSGCLAEGPPMFYGPEDRIVTRNAAIAAWNRAAPVPQPVQGEAVAWLEPGTLNSASPEDFAAAKAQWPDDYSDWFPVYTQPPAPAVVDDTPTIDLDALAWADIKQAARESKWMPPEYMANDWHSDVCEFLRNGPAVQIAAPGDVERETALAELEKWDACIAKSKKIDARACYGGWAIKHRDLILAALRSQGQADAVVDEATVLRACNAYDSERTGEDMAEYPAMHAALAAALAQQASKEQP